MKQKILATLGITFFLLLIVGPRATAQAYVIDFNTYSVDDLLPHSGWEEYDNADNLEIVDNPYNTRNSLSGTEWSPRPRINSTSTLSFLSNYQTIPEYTIITEYYLSGTNTPGVGIAVTNEYNGMSACAIDHWSDELQPGNSLPNYTIPSATADTLIGNLLKLIVEVDNTNDRCRFSLISSVYSTTTPWATMDYPTEQQKNIQVMNASFGTRKAYIDRIYIQNGLYSSTSTTEQCSTCTRIIQTDPTANQTLATSSSYSGEILYFVNPDDFISGSTYISYSTISLLNDYLATTSGETNGFLVLQAGSSIRDITLTNIVNGTYKLKINIYTLQEQPFWAFWRDDLITDFLVQDYTVTYYVGSPTTQADIDLAKAEQEARQFSPPQTLSANFKANLDEALNTFLYMPPIGYGTIIYNAFATTTATTAIAMTYTIAEGFPGEGLTLTLNASDAIANAISQIDSEVVATIDGSPFDEFMYYWQLLWYGALVIWIFKQVFGMFQLDITEEHSWSKPEEYQKSGNLTIQNKNTHYSNPGKYKQRTYMKRNQYSKYDR